MTLAVVAVLPLSRGPSIWQDSDDASTFLGLLWQVTAGTLGVAVAALVFLYESFGSVARRRRILSLAEFASRSGVLDLVGWLVVSLLLTGAVLLGWGDGAPMGWAAVLAIGVAVYALLALPKAFASAARLTGPDELQTMFQKSIRPKVAEAVRRDLMTIRMRELLDETLRHTGVTPRASTELTGSPALVVRQSGLVVDVDLKAMTTQLKTLPGSQAVISLFYRVRADDVLATVPTSINAPVSENFLEVIEAPRVGRKWDEFTLVRNLELDGLEAIRDNDETGLESCMQLHEEVIRSLLEFEAALTSSGMPSIAANTDLLESVRINLLRLHYASVDVGNEQASRTIAAATLRLMHVAVDVGETAMAGQFVSAAAAMATYEVQNA